MKTIANEKDLNGIEKMDEVKIVYTAEHFGKKYNSESEYHFIGKLKNKNKNYFVVSLIKPSEEYKKANFITTVVYGFGLTGQVKPMHVALTGYSYKNKLEQELERHFSILTRNTEDLG